MTAGNTSAFAGYFFLGFKKKLLEENSKDFGGRRKLPKDNDAIDNYWASFRVISLYLTTCYKQIEKHRTQQLLMIMK